MSVCLSVCVCVCAVTIEIHTSKAMTMSVCTRINARPGRVLVETRDLRKNSHPRYPFGRTATPDYPFGRIATPTQNVST